MVSERICHGVRLVSMANLPSLFGVHGVQNPVEKALRHSLTRIYCTVCAIRNDMKEKGSRAKFLVPQGIN
jgi:hypothetical protein